MTEPEAEPAKVWSWADFLTEAPPEAYGRVTELQQRRIPHGVALVAPDLVLSCDSEVCGGDRVFSSGDGGDFVPSDRWSHRFLTYTCKNCGRSSRLYAVLVRGDGNNTLDGQAIKMGEWPPFGPQVPARVISLVGEDRDLFLQGRRAENRNLGIGAFAYYRRVVENQKNRLLDEIIKVAQRVGAKPELVAALERAKGEDQFKKAVDEVKDAIPEALKIGGHNPLTLLHKALSQNLHERTDSECLELAHDIRVVLTELANRIARVLEDQAELDQAVARLHREINPQSKAKGERDG